MADIVRSLTAGELAEARWMFRANINFETVRIHRGKWFPFQPDDTAMAPNGHIYFPGPIYQPDFTISPSETAFLLHEMTHVWQTQSGVWLKMTRLFEGGEYGYGELKPDADLKKFTVEQQASIVADWYCLRHGLKPTRGSGLVGDYETVIRRAIPVGRP